MNSWKDIVLRANEAYNEGNLDYSYEKAIEILNACNAYPSPLNDIANSTLGEMFLNLADMCEDNSILKKIATENGFFCMLKSIKNKDYPDSQRAAMILFLFISNHYNATKDLCANVYNTLLELIIGSPINPFLRQEILATDELALQYVKETLSYCLSIFENKDTHMVLSIEYMNNLQNAVKIYKELPAYKPVMHSLHQFPTTFLWKYLYDEVNMNNGLKQSRLIKYN